MRNGDVLTAVGRSGKNYSYVWNDDPPSGTMKEVFFAPDKTYAIAFFTSAPNEQTIAKIETLVNVYRPKIFGTPESASNAYWSKIFCWPYDIVTDQSNRIGLVMPVYRKNFFFQNPPKKGKEKKSSWYFPADLKYGGAVPLSEIGDWKNILTACLLMARGVSKLHLMGLAHSDLSGNNVLVDALTGSTVIIDVDGLVVPDKFDADVMGTGTYVAPEVLAKGLTPSSDTDKYALSVLIYQLLLCRHPLEGRNRFGKDVHRGREYGADALFIENPLDSRARYDAKWVRNTYTQKGEEKALEYLFPWRDLDKLPYTALGPYLSNVIERAFVDGLHNPKKRPTAQDWERAIERTLNLIIPCENPKCVAKWFVLQHGKAPVCPFCGSKIRHAIPVLKFLKKDRNGKDEYDAVSLTMLKGGIQKVCRQVVCYNGLILRPSHAHDNLPARENRTAKQSSPLAVIQQRGDVWGIVNLRATNMTLTKNNIRVPVKVGTGKCLESGLRIQLDGPSSRVLEVEIIK